MSVNTIGAVNTACKDIFLILSLVDQSLRQLIAEQAKRAPSKNWDAPTLTVSASMDRATATFTLRGETRQLSVDFDCDADRPQWPSALLLSLGDYGQSEVIMKTVLTALSVLGPVVYAKDDGAAAGLKPLKLPKLTLMNLVRLGLVDPTRVARWVQRYDEGRLGDVEPFKSFFGIDRAWLRKTWALDYPAAWDEILAHATELPMPAAFEFPGYRAARVRKQRAA